ncbi:hypothetical protein B5F77_07395 [Parabacteroides sp. An277]|uniref:DUF6383 domain-containing protein n=1 Tax=Parabacteroides sp. An277 TaxID=1965619 RepID=UPI000B3AF508|nr:DUF6383 domain-containing protein [Parabacteroides sp. An277]OUO52699.1 hypothetical protein B5F77_07395 [Parabacteroides sp. An277]
MNKKVLTLCAGFLLAGNAVAFASVFGTTSTQVKPTTGYSIQEALFKQNGVISVDNSDAVAGKNASFFPSVSPFAISVAHGANPITELEHINGKEESRYFQFVVGDKTSAGKEVLTMVWVADNNVTGNANQGHYELQVENVENANIPNNRILLDRTLWKVTVKKETAGAGNTLYYTLQNKATDAILQLTIGSDKPEANKAIALDPTVVAGQTQWRWAQGENATQPSTFDGTAAPRVLQGVFSAQFDNGTTLVLAKAVKNNVTTFKPILINSNDETAFLRSTIGFADATDKDTKYFPVTFESWEANPILLTADQINAELGNDVLVDGKNDGKFKFTFDPGVQGDVNVMDDTFTAEPAIDGADRVPGDAPDGFVRFTNSKGTLMVDTTYYNEDVEDRYELKMAVRDITFPRQAVIADNTNISTVQGKEADGTLYTSLSYSAAAYVQMNRQANFRPIFYPSTQTLRLQAEMIYKKAKDGRPWWRQVYDDIDASTGYITIANYAYDNRLDSEDIVSSRVNAVGYYPAYVTKTEGDPGAGIVNATFSKQALSYNNAYKVPTTVSQNKYRAQGEEQREQDRKALDVWNAVANTNLDYADGEGTTAKPYKKVAPSFTEVGTTYNDGYGAMRVIDPAATNQTPGNNTKVIYSPNYVLAYNNVVKLVTLTAGHKVLTTDIHDQTDNTYNGLLTNISLAGLRQTSDIDHTTANIPEGFYYIQNANKSNTLVAAYGDYRYEDLAATNALETVWDENIGTTGDWAIDENDNAAKGNLVYSEDKLIIPSAQWYIKGNGNQYRMFNRESGRQWGTEYWWATQEEGVYVNQATYTNAAGQLVTYRDTIRLTAVPAADLHKPHLGYLWMEQDEAMADTTVYNVGITSLGEVNLSLSVNEEGNLVMTPDSTGAYKLERVLEKITDPYDGQTHKTTELLYGYTDYAENAADTLVRAKYYIYKDEVNANSGIEPSSIKTREYITLDGGKYKLSKVQVKFDNNFYTTEVDGKNVRRAFYVKQITPDANQFVLVDPEVVGVAGNNTGDDVKEGARVFVNQLTAELQPGSLVSEGYANPYANSILNLNKVGVQNYADIRAIGADRDTVEFFVANAPTYKLGENSQIKGAKVGLLDLRAENADINTAIFVDTANVNNAACPRFLLGVRDYDKYETSNLDHHNRHLWTKAAYLVNLKDSVDVNPAYYYRNIDQNATTYYRLGFLDGTHKGTTLTLDNGTKFELSDEALGENGLNIATFAFRYCDTSRENFYIETMYDDNTRGWICIHNGVAAVTKNIQEAEVFSMAQNDNIATSNEAISAEEGAVSVVATDGAVIVKGAEGKNVVIATILGKVVANETVNSDNETIAVPAGIAVVSVDGESFKVVVK